MLSRLGSGRRYLVGSGVWFVILGLIVAGVTVTSMRDPVGRVFGVAFGAFLLLRGALRLRQAREAPRDVVNM